MKEQPLVAVIVPCYQQAEFLDESLNSVLNQTYTNWECIVVNDGSTDNTEIITNKWIQKDKRFKYIFKTNGGVCSARNLGIEETQAEFILPLDADDIISNDYIEETVKVILEGINVKVVYGKVNRFGEINDELASPQFSLQELAKDNIIPCTALYRKKHWAECNGYDENMKQGIEDWEFWISLLKNGGEVVRINQIKLHYRIKKISRNNSIESQKREELKKYLSVKHADFFVKYLGSIIDLYSYKVAYQKINDSFIFKTFRKIFKR